MGRIDMIENTQDSTEATALVYILSDPCTGAVRYVGITTGSLRARWLRHMRYKGDDHRTAWVQSLLAAGVKPVIAEIDVVPLATRGDAEQRWIAFYRAQGADLTNGTRGGLGSPGLKHTEVARARMSQKRRGRKFPGRAPITDETRERIRQATIRQFQDPAQREAVSRVHKGKTLTEDQRRAVSEASTRRWAEWRAEGKTVSEESRERMRQAARARPAPPPPSAETRAKQAEARRRWWAARRAAGPEQMTMSFD